jgi:hypothetical protein
VQVEVDMQRLDRALNRRVGGGGREVGGDRQPQSVPCLRDPGTDFQRDLTA